MTPMRQTIFVADHPKRRGNCQSACLASVLDLPLAEVIDTTSDECRADFWGSIARWLADRGLKTVDVAPNDPRLKGVYSIASGPSPRGPFHHAIVCKSGRMVFDPHPSDDGVKKIERHQIVQPLSEAEATMHKLGILHRKPT